MQFSKIISALAVFAAAQAVAIPTESAFEKRSGLSCGSLSGAFGTACSKLESMGLFSLGLNAKAPSEKAVAWLGATGTGTQTNFTNSAKDTITLVLWHLPLGDYAAMCMNSRQPQITQTLKPGDSVVVTIADGVSGAFSAVYPLTAINFAGQISNTWGEFTTGPYGTIDVSREVAPQGNGMSITTSTGCKSNFESCYFACTSLDAHGVCGEAGSYLLHNCPEQTDKSGMNGGCPGMSGKVSVAFE